MLNDNQVIYVSSVGACVRHQVLLVADACMRKLRCMYQLALKDEVAAMATGEDWPSYVRRITHGASPKDIAQTLHVNRSLIDRWLTKESRPSTENVVAFARTFHGKPVEALVAAGYLDPHDIGGAVEIVQPLSTLSDDALLNELRDRLSRRGLQIDQSARRTPMGQLRDKSKRRAGDA